jgi:hypothetical protein
MRSASTPGRFKDKLECLSISLCKPIFYDTNIFPEMTDKIDVVARQIQ